MTLQWQAHEEGSAAEFMLQESAMADFSQARTRYQGPHHSSVLSGLPNGSYYFRVRARQGEGHPWGTWSAPEVFTVKHHPLSLAFILFGLGAAVFGLTLTFLVAAARKEST